MLYNNIEDLFKKFNIRTLLHKCNIKKRTGQPTDSLVFDLFFISFLLLLMVVVLSACGPKQEKSDTLENRQIKADSMAPKRHPLGASDTMTSYRRQWQTWDEHARRNTQVQDDTSYQDKKKLEIYMEAKTWISVGNYDKAIEWYKRFENYQENQGVLCKIAECYAMKGDPDRAFAFIYKYYALLENTVNEMESSPGDPTGFRYSHPRAMQNKEFKNLHNDPRWKRVESKASDFIQRIAYIKKQYQDKVSEDAQELLEYAREDMKQASEVKKLHLIVDSLEQIGDFDQAIKLCKDVVDYQESYMIWLLLARLYAEKQNKDQAFACLNSAFKITEQSPLPFTRDILVNSLDQGDYFKNLHSDPRWSDIDKQIKEVQNR